MIGLLKRMAWLRARLEQPLLRCITCGRLLGMEMVRVGTCAGHRLRVEGEVSVLEFARILAGKVK